MESERSTAWPAVGAAASLAARAKAVAFEDMFHGELRKLNGGKV